MRKEPTWLHPAIGGYYDLGDLIGLPADGGVKWFTQEGYYIGSSETPEGGVWHARGV
jgi:hypothetical protein